MDAKTIEAWSFGRSEAAALVGMTSAQVGNYFTRYDLFPGAAKGKGYHVGFKLRDLMKLGAVKVLIDHGLSPVEAAGALRPLAGPYSALLQDGFGHDQEPAWTHPGTLVFTRNQDGRWVSIDDADRVLRIEIRAWPLFDALWPRVRAQILKEGSADPKPYPGDVEEGIAAYESKIEALRAERWNERRN